MGHPSAKHPLCPAALGTACRLWAHTLQKSLLPLSPEQEEPGDSSPSCPCQPLPCPQHCHSHRAGTGLGVTRGWTGQSFGELRPSERESSRQHCTKRVLPQLSSSPWAGQRCKPPGTSCTGTFQNHKEPVPETRSC